jgi:hypothetical protein
MARAFSLPAAELDRRWAIKCRTFIFPGHSLIEDKAIAFRFAEDT